MACLPAERQSTHLNLGEVVIVEIKLIIQIRRDVATSSVFADLPQCLAVHNRIVAVIGPPCLFGLLSLMLRCRHASFAQASLLTLGLMPKTCFLSRQQNARQTKHSPDLLPETARTGL